LQQLHPENWKIAANVTDATSVSPTPIKVMAFCNFPCPKHIGNSEELGHFIKSYTPYGLKSHKETHKNELPMLARVEEISTLYKTLDSLNEGNQ